MFSSTNPAIFIYVHEFPCKFGETTLQFFRQTLRNPLRSLHQPCSPTLAVRWDSPIHCQALQCGWLRFVDDFGCFCWIICVWTCFLDDSVWMILDVFIWVCSGNEWFNVIYIDLPEFDCRWSSEHDQLWNVWLRNFQTKPFLKYFTKSADPPENSHLFFEDIPMWW